MSLNILTYVVNILLKVGLQKNICILSQLDRKKNVKPCRKSPTKRDRFPSEDFQTSHTKNFSATCTSMYVPDPAEFVEISASETSRPTNLGLHDSKANQKNDMTGIFIDFSQF